MKGMIIQKKKRKIHNAIVIIIIKELITAINFIN